jgi:hypothetical protein
MLLGFINHTPARLASESVAGRLTLLRSRGKLGICDKGEGVLREPGYFMNCCRETAKMGVLPGTRRVLVPRRT